jgi:ligand-binding SRPBCC domain-containing protein
VTWSARHFRWRWRLTSRITGFDRPHHFRDSMVAGVFERFDHDHEFEARGKGTVVQDVFDFTSPWGALGRLADRLVVTRHMRRFLEQRMAALKRIAESAAWRRYLPVAPHTSAAVRAES